MLKRGDCDFSSNQVLQLEPVGFPNLCQRLHEGALLCVGAFALSSRPQKQMLLAQAVFPEKAADIGKRLGFQCTEGGC